MRQFWLLQCWIKDYLPLILLLAAWVYVVLHLIIPPQNDERFCWIQIGGLTFRSVYSLLDLIFIYLEKTGGFFQADTPMFFILDNDINDTEDDGE